LTHDLGYLFEAADTLRRYLEEKHVRSSSDSLHVPHGPPPARRPIARHVPADDELPVALVTPRMLRDAPWASQLTCIARPPHKSPPVS
jgi:predicted HD phosphohydrolase